MNYRYILQLIGKAIGVVSYAISTFLLVSFFMFLALSVLVLLCKLFTPIENIMIITDDFYSRAFGEEVWPFFVGWFVIIPCIITVFTIVHESGISKSKKKEKSSKESKESKESITPSPEVLDAICLYKEIKNSNVDEFERIKRCELLLTEYEWYWCNRQYKFSDANVNAIWNAVCECDEIYVGNRYKPDMMSNICLKIQQKKS